MLETCSESKEIMLIVDILFLEDSLNFIMTINHTKRILGNYVKNDFKLKIFIFLCVYFVTAYFLSALACNALNAHTCMLSIFLISLLWYSLIDQNYIACNCLQFVLINIHIHNIKSSLDILGWCLTFVGLYRWRNQTGSHR